MADADGVFVENSGRRYKVMVLKDFIRFRDFALSEDGWKTEYEAKDKKILVSSRPPEAIPGEKPSSLNVTRVRATMETCEAKTIYDVLHDPEFRKTWDKNMLEGYNICKLNDFNDVGYYLAKFPWPLTNRDFCNMRSWMEFTNGDYVIFNHSEPHAECPERKDAVRAKSFLTGYFIQKNTTGPGCVLTYITHTDICGSVPQKLISYAVTNQLPNTMKELEKRGTNYVEWSRGQYAAGHVHGWATPKHTWESSLHYPKTISDEAEAAIIGEAASSVAAAPETFNGDSAPADVMAATQNIRDGLGASDAEQKGEPVKFGGAASEEDALVMKQMATKIDELRRQLFIATQQGEASVSLAPVAPARSGDSEDVLRFRAIMNDACNYVDRQFVQEGHVPTTREYLTRLHYLLEGMRRTTTLQQ